MVCQTLCNFTAVKNPMDVCAMKTLQESLKTLRKQQNEDQLWVRTSCLFNVEGFNSSVVRKLLIVQEYLGIKWSTWIYNTLVMLMYSQQKFRAVRKCCELPHMNDTLINLLKTSAYFVD